MSENNDTSAPIEGLELDDLHSDFGQETDDLWDLLDVFTYDFDFVTLDTEAESVYSRSDSPPVYNDFTHRPSNHSIDPEKRSYRQRAISKWLAKRAQRNWKKQPICEFRKKFASSRVRVRGRFVKSSIRFLPVTEFQ